MKCAIGVGDTQEREHLARRLKSRRKECGMTLVQVAESTGLSVSFLSDIETGRTHPSLVTLVKLTECYHTSIAALFIEADAEEYIRHVRIALLERGIAEMQAEIERLKQE